MSHFEHIKKTAWETRQILNEIDAKPRTSEKDFISLVRATEETNAELLNHLKRSQIEECFRLLAGQFTELWKLDPDSNPEDVDACKQFINGHIQHFRYNWIIDNANGEIVPVLLEKDFDTVFYSRPFPQISDTDIKEMGTKKVLFLGCSTNSPVAIGLLSQGLKHFTLSDFDTLEISNNNRVYGGSIYSLGRKKTTHLARQILHMHPYVKVHCFNSTILEHLEAEITKTDLVFEMIDDPGAKLLVRVLAKKAKKPVCMVTGIGDQPIVIRELPTDSHFHRSLSDKKLAQLSQKDIDIKEKFRLYIEIIGRENIPPEVMANMILAATGKRRYIGQHGGTALIGGGLGAYIARQLLTGYEVKKEVAVDVRGILSNSESIKRSQDKLHKRLQELFPDVFTPKEKTLSQAINRLEKEVFGLS